MAGNWDFLGRWLAAPLFSATGGESPFWNWDHLVWQLLAAAIFTALGLIVLGICYWLINKYTVFSLHEEIIDKKNLALAVLLGAIVIAIALIVSAAIHG
jgi:hypothetical protein